MGETEQLERQLQRREDSRRQAESSRRRELGGLEEAVEGEFKTVQAKIKELHSQVGDSTFLVHLNLAEQLLPIAEAYDRAVQKALSSISEFNSKVRSREAADLRVLFEELNDNTASVLTALRDISVKLDKFAGNLELERKVLLDVDKELNRYG